MLDPAHLFVEALRVLLWSGPVILAIGGLAVLASVLLKQWSRGSAPGIAAAIWDGLLLLASPIHVLAGHGWRAWELEMIWQRCGDFGCESDFYFGTAAGTAMAAVALICFLACGGKLRFPRPIQAILDVRHPCCTAKCAQE